MFTQSGLLQRACSVFLIGAAIVASTTVTAQTYPSQPIRLIVPYLAGGVTDVMARQFSRALAKVLKQQIIVENKAGANTLIGTQAVAHAAPNGSTLFFTDLSLLSYNAYLYKKPPYNLARDFTPVASVAAIPLGLAINGALPANTLDEFIAYAKANPGKLNYASAASGGLPHLGMENFKAETGIEMTHVPYKGGVAAITDLIGGRVQAMLNDVSTSVGYSREGKMKVLAISGDKRMPKLSQVPTFAELGHANLAVSAIMGIVAPAGTPPEVVRTLEGAIRVAANDPEVKEYLASNNLAMQLSTGGKLKETMQAEEKRWRTLVARLGITVD